MSTSTKKVPALRGPATRLAVLALACLLIAGCGGDGEETTTAPIEGATQPPHGTAPQSAGETVPGAPDEAISDRPGGPGSEGSEATEGGAEKTRAPSPTDERLIERAVRRYVAALNAHDGRRLCALLSPGALDGVRLPERRGSCRASLNSSIGHPAPGGAPRWLHTRLVDADAVVLVRGGDGRLTGTVVHRFAGSREPSIEDDVVYLRKLGGRWLIVKPSATFYRAIGARDVPLSALRPPAGG